MPVRQRERRRAGGCKWGDPAFPGGGVLDATGSRSVAAHDTILTLDPGAVAGLNRRYPY